MKDMGMLTKILILAGLIIIDVAILLLAKKLLFKKGLQAWVSGIILVVGTLVFGGGVYLNHEAPPPDNPVTAVTAQAQVESSNKNQVIKDIKQLFHKSPAEIEKILGKPNGPITPLQGGDHTFKLKNGKQVPVTVGTYLNGSVQINFLNGIAGHVWITLNGTYKYPADTVKLLTTYGIPVIKAPARVTPFSVDWENTFPGIYKVQFSTSEGRITDIGVIFLGAEDLMQ
jgi:hypothetical protein